MRARRKHMVYLNVRQLKASPKVTSMDKAWVKRSHVWSNIKALSAELVSVFHDEASCETFTVISCLGEINKCLLKRPNKAIVLSPLISFGILELTT